MKDTSYYPIEFEDKNIKNKKTFVEIKERIWKKFQKWKEKLLFQAKKEILIKVVAFVIFHTP